MKKALVLGGGGFIGSHLVKRLKNEGYWVRAADVKYPEFSPSKADDFLLCDLRNYNEAEKAFKNENSFDEVYQLAADMGGATYINCGENDANVISNSVTINLNIAKLAKKYLINKLFFSSSACVYKNVNDHATCVEEEVYPAFPDNEYGWEKLFSERMYQAYNKNYGLNVKIARFHSIVGPESVWTGGKEKAHSALARKVANVDPGGSIEIIGDGNQKRTFLFIDDCLDAISILMKSNTIEPVNIGSDHLVSINEYVGLLKKISKKEFNLEYVNGPTGVHERECSIKKIKEKLGWSPKVSTELSAQLTYEWIQAQIIKK